MSTALLELSTKRIPRNIRIDGTAYPLVDPLDLDLPTIGRLEAIGARIGSLGLSIQESNDEGTLAELSEALKAAVSDLLDAPADVLARLSDAQLLGVVVVYTEVSMPAPAKKPGRKPTSKRISAKRR